MTQLALKLEEFPPYRLKQAELIHALGDVGETLSNNVDGINYGGCCVMAAIMGAALEAVGYRVEIITRAYAKYDIPSYVRDALIERGLESEPWSWVANGLNTSHLALRIHLGNRIITWDSDGVGKSHQLGGAYGGDREYPFGHGLSVEEAMLLGETPTGWNSHFDRWDIPELERIVYDWTRDTFGIEVDRHPMTSREGFERVYDDELYYSDDYEEDNEENW